MTATFCKATAREVGSQVVHTVIDWHGRIAGTRRSAHRYQFAICHRIRHIDTSSVIVDRWSRSDQCSSNQFAIAIKDA